MLLQAKLGKSTSISPTTILGIGLLSGLLAGAGVALIREQFDQRLHSTVNVEEATGEPILTEVAAIRRRRKQDLSLPTALHGATAFNESIRRLRTSLQVLTPQRSAVVMTSPDPGDGKSFLAANLAVSMSLAGRSVIVVGGDLRRAQLGAYFDLTQDVPGFANAIENNAAGQELWDLLRPTAYRGLMVLAAGQSKAEPADLLATSALGQVVTRLRTMADVVLIDTPPALALADAAIIARHADGVVAIATLGRTQRESLVGTLRVLRANGSHILGVVANRSRRTMPDTYRQYLTPVAGWELPRPGAGFNERPADVADADSAVGAHPRLATRASFSDEEPRGEGSERAVGSVNRRTHAESDTEVPLAPPPGDEAASAHLPMGPAPDRHSGSASLGRTSGGPGAAELDEIEAQIKAWTFEAVVARVDPGDGTVPPGDGAAEASTGSEPGDEAEQAADESADVEAAEDIEDYTVLRPREAGLGRADEQGGPSRTGSHVAPGPDGSENGDDTARRPVEPGPDGSENGDDTARRPVEPGPDGSENGDDTVRRPVEPGPDGSENGDDTARRPVEPGPDGSENGDDTARRPVEPGPDGSENGDDTARRPVEPGPSAAEPVTHGPTDVRPETNGHSGPGSDADGADNREAAEERTPSSS